MRQIRDQGGRLDWSASRDLIAYDKEGANDFYEVWTMRPDGSGDICLTCGSTAIPRFNRGNPAWHPSGNFLAIQVQKEALALNDNGRPGVGVNNDIWIMDAEGKRYWRITDVPVRNGGVLHAHFSNAGDKLLWSERISGTPLPAGTWVMRLADFSISGGEPRVTNIRTLTPGTQKIFYETHGFSKDDKTILFSGSLEAGQAETALDIYSLELATNRLVNLTATMDEWDEHAHATPGGKIIWMSSMRANSKLGQLKTEYWMMDMDGSNKNQITWFNDSRSPDYFSTGVVCGDSSWNADGTRLAAYLISGGSALGGGGRIRILDFEPAATAASAASYARPPVSPDFIASIFGTNLAKELVVAPGGRFPMDLGGTSVTIKDAKGVDHPAPLYFVSPGQINLQIPGEVAQGPAVFTARNAEGVESRATVSIEAFAPSFYSMNADGRGVAAGYIQRVSASGAQTIEPVYRCTGGAGTCSTLSTDLGSASDQLFLVLFGTGIRGRGSLTDVVVTVGGQRAEVVYAGPQPEYPGYDQLVARLPRTLAGAGVVNVIVRVGGVQANAVQIEVR
jgi:uncharacterized protein (TIGR03437 family)